MSYGSGSRLADICGGESVPSGNQGWHYRLRIAGLKPLIDQVGIKLAHRQGAAGMGSGHLHLAASFGHLPATLLLLYGEITIRQHAGGQGRGQE